VGKVRRKEKLSLKNPEPAAWRVPHDFPEPQKRILGTHQGRAAALLEAEGSVYAVLT
jgi:hypothetical protein